MDHVFDLAEVEVNIRFFEFLGKGVEISLEDFLEKG